MIMKKGKLKKHNSLANIKLLIILISLFFLIIIVFLTVDVINENEGDVRSFDIDFKGSSSMISSYGSLIGSLLSFISILFLIYTILQQKHQFNSKQKSDNELLNEEYKNYILLILSTKAKVNSYLESTTIAIREFQKSQQKFIDTSSGISLETTSHFKRILEMPYGFVFKAFNHFVEEDKSGEGSVYYINKFYKNLDYIFENHSKLEKQTALYLERKLEKIKKFSNEVVRVNLIIYKMDINEPHYDGLLNKKILVKWSEYNNGKISIEDYYETLSDVLETYKQIEDTFQNPELPYHKNLEVENVIIELAQIRDIYDLVISDSVNFSSTFLNKVLDVLPRIEIDMFKVYSKLEEIKF